MALSRSMLKGMDLTEEQVTEIINAHMDTVNALKEQIADYREKADKFDSTNSELTKLKSEGGDWKAKYEKEHSEYEAYKSSQNAKETRAAREAAYSDLLKDAGINEKRIPFVLKHSNLDDLEIENGKVKDSKDRLKAIKEDWAEFLVKEDAGGVQTPSGGNNSGGASRTKEEIMKIKNTTERQKAWADYLSREN